jgi:translation initiation factor 2 subunit 1
VEKNMSNKKEWPERGEFVIATIERITGYGAYVWLDGYGKEGFLHRSQIASGWIRNIRNFIREEQKTVLKVLRVNEVKAHVDLSLRRVNKRQRRETILSWKKDKQAEGILRSASEKLHVPFEEIYEKTGVLIDKKSVGLYEVLEETARDGIDVLLNIGMSKEVAGIITEIAKEKIKSPAVKIKGTLELRCTKPNGVALIQEALLTTSKIETIEGATISVHVISPPRYRVEVLAENYKIAERILQEATEAVLKKIRAVGGKGTFKRVR